uniref:Helix-turn-helix domain protein n=1 Tax=Myoviridae sp. cthAo37 TaxID=2827701 RepID=A0A8S5S4V9_9CAUD|nr:MAG TPA: helix-turn-helix domain protein [Myoviridae sp. cthAo37]
MQEMKDRIVSIRKESGLTQEEFGKELNLSQNYVWMLESGKRAPSARTIIDLCKKFQISEEWLRTGEGEMKAPMTKQAEIATITAQLFHKEETDPETYNFLIELNKYLLQLDETQMQAVLDMVRKLNAAISKGEK